MKPHPNAHLLREGSLPHMFCPGCGCGQIMNYFLYAVQDLKLDMDKLVLIGGVGCNARIPVFIKADAIHGVHGRTLAWATGVKMANPELTVVVFTGDGDCGSIGGNHFIHAARRNLDVTVLAINNGTFGMTGGQAAPTTPLEARTSTSPLGNIEPPFDFCKLAEAAGATYVSRWTTAHTKTSIESMKKAIQHKGFAFIEMISQCPTYYGRYVLRVSETLDNLNWLRNSSVTLKKAGQMDEKELEGKIIVGEFVEKHLPTLEERYIELERKAGE